MHRVTVDGGSRLRLPRESAIGSIAVAKIAERTPPDDDRVVDKPAIRSRKAGVSVEGNVDIRIVVADGPHVVRPEVKLEARLAIHDQIAVVLPVARSVIVVNRERGIVIGKKEIAGDVIPRWDGRGCAVTQRGDVR